LEKQPENKLAVHRRLPLLLPSLILFLAIVWATAIPYHPQTGWNVNTRLALIFAIVDRGTIVIDDYHDEPMPTATMDKAYFGGHYYSDKTFGASLLALPAYWLARQINGESLRFEWGHYLSKFFSSALPAGAGAVLLLLLLCRTGTPPRWALVIVSLLFFGSGWFGYATTFYPYAAALAFGLGALYLILFPPANRLTALNCFSIGFLLGYTILCELTMVFWVFGLGCVWLARLADQAGVLGVRAFAEMCGERTRILHAAGYSLLFWVGVLLAISPFLAYCYAAFGEFSIPYQYEVNQEFLEGMSQGIMGITTPKVAPFWYLTLHPFRGLFFWTPLLLLGLVGAGFGLAQYGKRRLFAWLAIYTTLAYLYFNISYYMWWGGWGMGPRFLLPIVPMLGLAVGELVREGRLSAFERRSSLGLLLRRLVVVTGVAGLLLTMPLSLTEPQVPQAHTSDQLTGATIRDGLRVPQFVFLRGFYTGRIGFLPSTRLQGQIAGAGSPAAEYAFLLFYLLIIGGGLVMAWRLLPANLPGMHRRDYPFATVDGAAAPPPQPARFSA
jgi:hypothetical protein